MSLNPTLRRLRSQAGLKLRRWRTPHAALRWVKDNLGVGFYEALLVFCRHLWREHERFGPPGKTVSIYQALRTGSPKLRGRIVLHDQGSPQVTDDSLMARGGYYQHKEQPWPIFWSEHRRPRLVSESLALLLEKKQLGIESVYGPGRWQADPGSRYFRLPPPVQLAGNWTSIISRWTPGRPDICPNYTHWMLDALPRLALLSEFPPDTRILVPPKLDRNQRESLEMLGVWDRCRPTPEIHVQPETYYFSSFTTMLQGYNPYGIDFLRRTYLPQRDPKFSGPKKIFIQRRGLLREPQNRAELESLFVSHGWVVLDLMQFSLAEKIKLFAEAEAVAGIFSSGFTNCIFCRPDCRVMAIMPEDFGLDGYVEWIAQVVGFQWQALVVPGSYDYQYAVDLEPLKKWLEAGEGGNQVPSKDS